MCGACDPELPEAGDVWGGAVENADQWWESLVCVAEGVSATSQEIFDISVTKVESVVEPDGTADDAWRESAALVCIHWPILSIQTSLFVSTLEW
jgi:hypothetical protein